MRSRGDNWENEPGFDPLTGKFKHIDLDRWLKEKKVVEQARKDGKQNKPSIDESFDGIPAKIVAWVNNRGRICRQNVSTRLDDLERQLADIENPQELEISRHEAEETAGAASAALEGEVNKGRNILSDQQEYVREEDKDFQAFRRESGLRRLPDDSGRKWFWRYVLGFFFFELVINATTLMDANPFGLLGAMVQMGMICAVNILIMGWIMGGVVRGAHYIGVFRKAIFSLLAVAIFVAVVCFNLVVGHFRDSMQAIINMPAGAAVAADLNAVGSDTFDRFLEGWIMFDSFQSALLALMGFLFFCVASWKWFDRDDRYPGYGRRHRQRENRKQDYLRKYGKAERNLEEKFRYFEDRLKDIREKLRLKQSRYREILSQGERIIADYPTNLGQYQHDLNRLLGAYYSANRQERSEPEPTWFSELKEVDKEILSAPEFNVPEQESIKDVADTVDRAIKVLQEEFRKSRRQFPTLEQAMNRFDSPSGFADECAPAGPAEALV